MENIPRNLVPKFENHDPHPPNPLPSYTHSPVTRNTTIIGVCGVPLDSARSSEDGWFLLDFAAFNFLFRGLGGQQTWITTESEEALLAYIDQDPDVKPGYLHGNPYRDRRIVFSRELVDGGELTPFTTIPPDRIIAHLKAEIESATAPIDDNQQRHVLLFIFGHGDPKRIYLDYSIETESGDEVPNAAYFSTTDLRSAMHIGANVTLITTACYSGRWAADPSLNVPLVSAAGGPSSGNGSDPESSLSWNTSASSGRLCGSPFGTSTIQSFCRETAQAGWHHMLTETELEQLSSLETATYNKFCHTVLGVLADEVVEHADWHSFSFSAQNNTWARSWLTQTGIPLSHFQRRWNQAPVHPSRAARGHDLDWRPRDDPPRDDQDPSFPTGAVASLLRRMDFPRSDRSVDSDTLRYLAIHLYHSCPGDWEVSPNIPTHKYISDFIRGIPLSPARQRFIKLAVPRRVFVAWFLDAIVDIFGLPRPSGKTCLQWHSRDWFAKRHTDSNPERWSNIVRCLRDEGLDWDESWAWRIRNQIRFPGFRRAQQYIAASLFISDIDATDIIPTVHEMRRYYDETEPVWESLVLQMSV